jgi:transcriptional regulator GlxA family with amidase domain
VVRISAHTGGSITSWNLLLYLIEKHINREMTIKISKYFLLNMEQASQLPFAIFMGQQEHGDKVVLAAQKYIEEHTKGKFNIEKVAGLFNLGHRTFE